MPQKYSLNPTTKLYKKDILEGDFGQDLKL
jgi:hypothetical protein